MTRRPQTREELIEAFRTLDVSDPEVWASSEVDEGINQLGRAAVLVELWKGIVDGEDLSWIDNVLAHERRVRERTGVEGALGKVLASGADRADVARLVRELQVQAVFHACGVIDGDVEQSVDVAWALFEIDAAGRPILEISGLHESLGETDPTGPR